MNETATKNRRWPAILAAVGVALIALVLVFALAGGDSEPAPADERPGEPASYERITALSDCSELQREFDSFMAVFDANEKGTERATVALSYAEHAEARRQELDC